MTATAAKPVDRQQQANNLAYLLLGLTIARWNSEVDSGKDFEDYNLFLDGSPIHGTIRHMGERLNESGGLKLMMAFMHFFSVRIPADDEGIDRAMIDWAQMELNVAWNGIGDW